MKVGVSCRATLLKLKPPTFLFVIVNPHSRVTMLRYDPLRDAQIMMTGHGTHLRWQVATDQVQ